MITTSANSGNRHSILCVVGARPNFMKMAPIIAALKNLASKPSIQLLHTGQHYDVAMNHQYFEALGIPAPDINLDVGSGSHAVQTAEVMRRVEPVMDDLKPSAVLVVGDVNSTIACALVAAKKGIQVIHVEAGLRSFDRSMPEEINRVLTDQISDLLFTTERSGRDNLLREGIDAARIHFVGNVMIDTLLGNLERAIPTPQIVRRADRPDFPGARNEYALMTLHRPANVDDPAVLKSLLETALTVSRRLPVIFPMHPRTKSMIEKFGFIGLLNVPQMLLLPPMGYLEMLGLMKDARLVLTDSGGIQEETTALGVPCITLRNNTERPITVDEGTNTIAGTDPETILRVFDDVMRTGGKAGRAPKFWDGKAAVRIAETIEKWMAGDFRA
ncbi:MAG TPA: UDP-N-acetylglucosamine 2-epimerase (non-hydrolyzing) [Noviherbaspirillum sp.]|jgi:UDP-N-acetylglucosamine 2-epimerase (non-hydrolysing)|uniref:non-hydrolyzing UDP-N-acetylglucosamine 2-epimerase n=1 Tax=Noviherbaspirillum sp. TaxID=1926288 RepID=UPI002DDD47E8|nr:UDP-N-acetylglucosamine 2-epimerase (non-hydrolyzing) [Noviherbaspirillum sp.]HEV2612180.1 UDP-N-acetylglucosamine 2-epimerase (non-hydrolyzing) [Noviherbaspirillum sp.]